MKKFKILTETFQIIADIYETRTAQAIEKQLPLSATVNTWGEEIYFSIPVHLDQEADAREEVEPGELGYWPVGNAFCIFFGPTPVSSDDKPRAFTLVCRSGIYIRIRYYNYFIRNVSDSLTVQKMYPAALLLLYLF